MANIQLGGGVTDIRGSIGGTTFSRNAGGNYARARMKPVNPRSELQNARRSALAWLTKYWSNDLTEQQRTDWRDYAAGTTWTNKLGQSIEISGLAAFLRVSMYQRIFDAPPIDAAPTAMGHAGGIGFTFAAESDTSKIQMDEPTGAWDTNIDIQTILFFQGIPQEAGRLTTPKRFNFLGRIWGSSGAPLAFPYELDSVFTMQVGQLITIRAMFQDENYRLSGPFWGTDLAALA